MSFLDLVRRRQSDRGYSDRPVEREQIERCLEDAVMNRFAASAPVLVAVVAEPPALLPRLGGLIKDKPYYLMDIGMATEHFCLQAADESLGSCIIGWFNESGVKKLLGIPKGKRVPLVIALGYPADPATRSKVRREPETVWSYNGYPSSK